MEEGFAFVEEGGGAAEVVSWLQSDTEISNALLGDGVFQSFGGQNTGASSDGGRPSAGDKDVCRVGTV